MFLPIGDAPRPPGTPWLTYSLIAANVAVYVLVCLPLMGLPVDRSDPNLQAYLEVLGTSSGRAPLALLPHISAYDVFMFTHGFRPDAPSLGGLFGSMFVHAGALHLGGNMLFLYIFGDNVEMRLGGARYLMVYLFTGVVATLAFALFAGGEPLPLVGASGAISGVLGCYFVWFPHNRVKVLMALPLFFDVLLVPARLVLAFYVVVENLLPFVLGHAGGGGVAYGAHLGGFGSGAALAWWWAQRPHDAVVREASAGFAAPAQAAASATPAASAAWASWRPKWGQATAADILAPTAAPPLQALVADGDLAAAAGVYASLSHADYHRVDPDDLLQLADWLTEERRFADALALLQRLIARLMGQRGADAAPQQLAQAHLRAGLLALRALQRPDAAYQHFISVLQLEPHWQVRAAATRALAELEKT